MAWMKAMVIMVIKTRQRPYRKEKKMRDPFQNYDAWKTSEPEEDYIDPHEDSAKLIDEMLKQVSIDKIKEWAAEHLEAYYSKHENYNQFQEDWIKYMEYYNG